MSRAAVRARGLASCLGQLCVQLRRCSGCLVKQVGWASCPPTPCPLQGLPGYFSFGAGFFWGFSVPGSEVPISVAIPQSSSLSRRQEAKTWAQGEAAACLAAQARGLRGRAPPGAVQLSRPDEATQALSGGGHVCPSTRTAWEPGDLHCHKRPGDPDVGGEDPTQETLPSLG